MKIVWEGAVVSVQPRIRLQRSFDERTHEYLGYVLRLLGVVAEEEREFSVAVGKGAHEKHAFRVGDRVRGRGTPVPDARRETAEFYKAHAIELLDRGSAERSAAAPFTGVPPALPVYRERRHRRLAARTYSTRCRTCLWGCRMPVEMMIDPWEGGPLRYRSETFCYGPKSCPLYRAGPVRSVPGRKGMVWHEEDWVDEDATSHRGPDD